MKLTLTILLCCIHLCSFAQIKAGLQVGYNQSSFTRHDVLPIADYYLHTASMAAFNAGFITSVRLSNRITIEPSLLLSEKGAKKATNGFRGPYLNTHLRIYYAHVPVTVMYKFVNSKTLQVSVGAGAYVSKGLWGKEKGSFASSDSLGMPQANYINNKVNFTNNTSDYKFNESNVKPWDAGYIIAAEAGFKNWQLKANYDFGTMKILGSTQHLTRVFSISAGYYFFSKE